MPSLTRILRRHEQRPPGRTRGGRPASWTLAAALLVVATLTSAPATATHAATHAATHTATHTAVVGYHDGVFSQAASRFCTSTDVFTPSRQIRTRIVRHSDGWSNTISSRYRKWVDCSARQMTPTMWCTTKLVDGFSGICISTKPKARGISPCANPRLDVGSVYFPGTGRLAITCVNKASRATNAVTRTDPRGDASPAKLDILRTRVTFDDRITVRTRFRAVRPGTGYVAFVDPGRRGGGLFRLWVHVRQGLGTTGHLEHHAVGSTPGQFTAARCAGLRTSVDVDTTTLRVSAPGRCLSRHEPLGQGIRVSLNSFALPIGPAGGDLLPDDQSSSFRVPRG